MSSQCQPKYVCHWDVDSCKYIYRQLDMIHFVNLTGLTRWNEAIVSPEDSKLSKETTYNAHSYITPSYL